MCRRRPTGDTSTTPFSSVINSEWLLYVPQPFNINKLWTFTTENIYEFRNIRRMNEERLPKTGLTSESFYWTVCCSWAAIRFLNITYINFFKVVWPCIVTVSLWIRPTDALNSNFIGIATPYVSGSLSAHHQEFLAVHRLCYILCSCDNRLLPGAAGWNWLWYILCSCGDRLLPGAGWNGVPSCVPVNSASVGLIHKETVTMHGHTTLKKLM